jgi:hypothetical protein
MCNTSNCKDNPTISLDNPYDYYPYSITWSKNTPKTFKISLNLKNANRKKGIWTINQVLKQMG